MHDTEELHGFEQRLLVELREVVRTQALAGRTQALTPRRRPRAPLAWPRWTLMIPAAAAVVVALLVGPAIVAPNGGGSSAYALEVLADGRVHVKVAADFDEGQRLQEDLRNAGVMAEIIRVESHPGLAGTIEFPQHQLPPKGVERGIGEFWIDPTLFEGTIEVLINVAPESGEWIQAPSVFHPDEPLGGLPCALPGPLDTASLERHAREVGITEFAWSVIEGDPRAQSRNVVRASDRPDGEVEHAERIAPDKLRVGVRPADVVEQYGHAGRPSMNLNVHESVEPACTAELTARWPNP